jgi:type II secretory pathway pseudopilin PulG
MSLLRFLLTNQLKCHRQAQKTGGFTLIELLMAMVLAFLVITPLLGFVVNILDTDRKEQAKANSEQELKAALDYIAQDLQQAVYIYDADGLNKTTTAKRSPNSGIKDQIPPLGRGATGCDNNSNSSCTPVLVFWKRELRNKVMPARNITPNNIDCANANVALKCDDAYVYSLVGYYLITGNSPGGNTWSSAARIARFQIRDGVVAPSQRRTSTPSYIRYGGRDLKPDQGFKAFDLRGIGTLKQKMNNWKKDGNNYSFAFGSNVLVDYIDLPNPNPSFQRLPPGGIDCDTTNINPNRTPLIPREQRVPSDRRINSFYACVSSPGVNANSNYARIYIRGNALARIQKTNPPPSFTDNNSSYFPTANIQVQGNGFLYNRQ